MIHTLKFTQKRFSLVSTKNPKVISASLEQTFTLNFLAWGFLDLITSLNVHWNYEAQFPGYKFLEKDFLPSFSRPRFVISYADTKVFFLVHSFTEDSPLNIQGSCKSLSSHYKALKVSRLHLLCLVTWAMNSTLWILWPTPSSSGKPPSQLYAYHAGFYFTSGSRSPPFVLC